MGLCINNHSVRQNLEDAGCEAFEIMEIMDAYNHCEKDKLLCLLTSHRRNLMDAFHNAKKRVDCMDYLIYRIKQEDK